MVEMQVVAVTPEPQTNRPLVWLKDKEEPSRVFLPIAIGGFEATAIQIELFNETPQRPITYDLLKSILEGLDAKVVQVYINALKGDTFYAEITLESSGTRLEIDSRPSDAIALALRVGAAIYVSEEVLESAGQVVPVEKGEMEQSLEAHSEELAVKAVVPAEAPEEIADPDNVQKKISLLKARLREAVAQEEYEKAARLRDQIQKMEMDEES